MLVKAKKSLGQNFLRSKAALLAIVECSNISTSDTVIEIGPGEGVLTEELLKTGAKVVAIEKDDRLIEILNQKFLEYTKQDKFELLHADVTDFDFAKLDKNYKVIANIPYYITGLIMRKLIDDGGAQSLTLLVQREVAERGCARDGKGSLLSNSILSYGVPKYVKTVPRGSFVPSPNVDSAILYIKRHDASAFRDAQEKELFFELIHAGFAHKRKTLLHNLNIYNQEKGLSVKWEQIIDSKVRAEDVHFEDWLRIVRDTIKLW